MTADEVFRQKLRNFRKANGLTQEEMAEKIGLNESYYRTFEKIHPREHETKRPINPTLRTLKGFAAAMGVSLSDLMEGVDDE